MFNAETDQSKLTPKDLERAEKANKIRQLARIAGELHVRGVSVSCGFSEEERRDASGKLQERLSTMSRSKAVRFLRNEEKRFVDFLSTDGNPGAHESQLAIQTRRLHLIGSVLKELNRQGEEEVNGGLVVVAVDAYLGLSDFGLDDMSLTHDIPGSTQ